MSAARAEPVAPGAWLGIMGGGQLGRMFCQAAQAMGYRVAVLDPSADSPAGRVADRQIVAAYDSAPALAQMGALCAAVSTEFENVPAASLSLLQEHCPVAPAPEVLAIAQDRIVEKSWLRAAGVPVAAHAPISTAADLLACGPELFPGILKTCRLGYDGKGQRQVADRAQAQAAWQEMGAVACVLEALQPLDYEISVVLARAADGQARCYPPARNSHYHGILGLSLIDGAVAADVARQAQDYALKIAAHLQYVGVLCVEFFVLADGSLLANEIAPRPHNSGHYTQDACVVSQFEQQARVLAGLPLGDTALLAPAAMINLLGDLWFDAQGGLREPRWADLLQIDGSRLHLYGKTEARRARKMGHLNIIAPDAAALRARVRQALDLLGLAYAC